MSRWGGRDRDAQVGAPRAGDPSLRLSWSRDTQPCYLIPLHCSQLSGRRGGGVSLGGAAAGVCQVRLSGPCQSRWGLLGGREGDGVHLWGGGLLFFNPFSASPGHSCLSEISGGDRLIPLPHTFPPPYPTPPKPPTSHILSDSITTGHRDLRPHCSSPPHSTVRLAHRTLFD